MRLRRRLEREKIAREQTELIIETRSGELFEANKKLQQALEETEREVEKQTHDLRAALDKTKAANTAKSDFLATMSHEIRTPLNAVIGLSHLMLRTDLTDQQSDYLDKIEASAKSLLQLINDILDYSKIEARAIAIESVTFNVDKIISNVCKLATVKVEEKGLDLLISRASSVPTNVAGDPLRISQVLTNLLTNAIKFTDQGEVILTVEQVNCASDDSIVLKFSVSDTGIGLTEAHKQKLFQSFSQADTSISRKYGGTGLGLAISHKLVKLMDGEFDVNSVFGKGSVFSFTAKLRECEEEDYLEALKFDVLENKRALVVDDRASSREIFVDMLLDAGLDVSSDRSDSTSMKSLVDVAEQYDLIVLESRVLKQAKTDILSKLSSNQRHSPRIIVTGYAQDGAFDAIQESDHCVALSKPVDPSTLKNTAYQLLSDSSSEIAGTSSDEPNQKKRVKGKQVLVVEDTEINQQVARELLTGFGAEVSIVDGGQESIDAVLHNTYDIILMDVEMPGMDGYEATARIRRLPNMMDIPIIAMTAHAMDSDRVRALQAGMNDHVAKPIDPEVLHSTLCRWLLVEMETEIDDQQESTTRSDPFQTLMPELEAVKAIKRLKGNEALYYSILEDFRVKSAQSLFDISIDLETEDYEDARFLTHTLRGGSAAIGAQKLADSLMHLESLLNEIPDQEKLAAALAKSTDYFNRVMTTLRYFDTTPIPSKRATNTEENIPTETNDIISSLNTLISVGDLNTLEHATKLENLLRDTEYHGQTVTLRKQIENFDFNLAAYTLNQLDDQLKAA